MQSDFKLVGLSKPCSLTCEPLHKEEVFWVKPDISKDRFDALFEYMRNNWDVLVIVELEHEGLKEDGTPLNPKFVQLKHQ